MIVKLLFLIILFFILGFVQGEFIKKGQWLVEKYIPNHWMGHAVWGIFWVVTACLILEIITLQQWAILFLVFLAAFPGIYLAGIERWQKCNVGTLILKQLKLIYKKII